LAKPIDRGEGIPVSPQMIKEGLRALALWKELPPGEVIAAVYRAMAAVAPVDRTHAAEPSPTIIEILNRLERK
jgi:hypothetical protein